MIVDEIRRRAAEANVTICFPDAVDARTLRACAYLQQDSICTPVLIGSVEEISHLADSEDIDISDVAIVQPTDVREETAAHILERRKAKGMTSEEAQDRAMDPLFTAGWMVHAGHASGAVAGSLSTTSDVLRAGLQTIGTAEGVNTVSSFFLMVFEASNTAFTYTDCGVVPDPTSDQLVDIAVSAARNHNLLTGAEARVAFLSFSTKGSAKHDDVDKVAAAAADFNKKYPDIIADGELQGDAALVPSVAHRKAPNSLLQAWRTSLSSQISAQGISHTN